MLKTLSGILVAISILFLGCSGQQPTDKNRTASVSMADSGPVQPTPGLDASDSEAYSAQETDRQDPDQEIYNSRHTAITEAVKKVSPATVSITVTEVRQGGRRLAFDEFYNRFFFAPTEREFSSMGSGFIISEDGLVVTNEHVADKNARKIMISLTDGTQYEAEILGADELADLALLKIKADRKFPYVEFGDSDEVMVGEWSLAIGNPFGLFEAAQPSVTVGVVSALNRDFRPDPNQPRVYLNMIQTDAAINRGNSGGPLVNSAGEVIGVNTFIFTGGTSSGFVGLGFAIPSNRVKKIIDQLASTGQVSMAYNPGMETTEMTYQLVRKYNLPQVPGLLVTSVNKDGPAFECGIVPGDIILKVGEERVQSQMHLKALFREYAEGDTMRIELLREGKRYEANMALRPKAEE
ncbi:MAG: trypsin-like peptidase domain-containing protein [Balneolaceae bacterium]|nr:trypsin-like peptidase domain-containing protein [Balneolaceae bacterium]